MSNAARHTALIPLSHFESCNQQLHRPHVGCVCTVINVILKKNAFQWKQELIWHDCCLSHFLQRWQRSCLILSRGISRTRGGDHTCWWRRRRPGKASISTPHTNTQDGSRLTDPASLFVFVCSSGFHVQPLQRGGNYSWSVWTGEWLHFLYRHWDFIATKEFHLKRKSHLCILTEIYSKAYLIHTCNWKQRYALWLFASNHFIKEDF